MLYKDNDLYNTVINLKTPISPQLTETNLAMSSYQAPFSVCFEVTKRQIIPTGGWQFIRSEC